MSNYAKAARLILAVTAPVLAMAQGPQAKPSPQVRSAASAPSGAAASPAPNSQAVQPAVVALPVIAKPQPALMQPTLITGSSAPATGNDVSAAVDYASGRLTVVSNRAPLSLVLKLVAAKTGAVVDLAPELQNEQVVARLGPGSVREVLTGLLDSPRIDYIVLGTGDEPGSLQRIVVRTRRSFGQVAMAATRPRQSIPGGPEDDEKLDQSGHLLTNGAAPAQGQLTQEQLMENWRKIREEKIQAEIKQQAEDRENEKNQPPEPPMPQDNPPQDNPPQQ